ncbi:MAG: hypothetical protein P8R54_04645 [Myxococcota bacterium]|nr:hypothetical protein [Myxococcota bacterium]
MLLLLSVAEAGRDCSSWGEISPAEPPPLYTGESYTLYVSGGTQCGDIDSCSWWLDEFNGSGELTPASGSPIDFVAPGELESCIPISFQLFLSCTDGATLDSVDLTIQCTAEDKEALIGSEEASLSGGGCGEISSALLLLPVVLLPRRRRRTAQ